MAKSLDRYMYELRVAVIAYRLKDGQDMKNAAHCTNKALYGTHGSRCTRERGVATEDQEASRSPPHHVPHGPFQVLRAEMSTVRCESFSSAISLMGCERMILSCFTSFLSLLCDAIFKGEVLLELTCSSLRFRIDAVLFTRNGGDCTGTLTRKDDQLMWLIAWPIRIFARACRR